MSLKTSWRLDSPHTIIQFPAAVVELFLRNGHFNSPHHNDSPIPKTQTERRRRKPSMLQDIFYFSFDSSFVPSFVALFIVWCIEILRCKKSHSRFFYDFRFCLVRLNIFLIPFLFIRSLFGKILFNVHEKAMRSDFITAPKYPRSDCAETVRTFINTNVGLSLSWMRAFEAFGMR